MDICVDRMLLRYFPTFWYFCVTFRNDVILELESTRKDGEYDLRSNQVGADSRCEVRYFVCSAATHWYGHTSCRALQSCKRLVKRVEPQDLYYHVALVSKRPFHPFIASEETITFLREICYINC